MNGNPAYQEEQREELIGGKFIAMSPATPQHNRLAFRIAVLFENHLKGKRCIPFSDGTAVFLTDEVWEDHSPSTAKNDRWHKKNVYEASGVPEYWLVDPVGKSIEVYLLAGGQYCLENIYYFHTEAEIAEMDEAEKAAFVPSFHCHLYDDLDISLADIFEDLF